MRLARLRSALFLFARVKHRTRHSLSISTSHVFETLHTLRFADASVAMDTNRLSKELREIAGDTKSGVTVTVLGDNLAHMQGTLQGTMG